MTPPAPRHSSGAAVTVACLALFTDMLVYGLAVPVLPLLPSVTAAGPAAGGALFAAYAVAMVAVTPLAGWLTDRKGARTPLLVGLLGLAAATLLFAVAEPVWLLMTARALQGLAGGMSWVAALSLIAASTPMSTRARSMGIALSAISLGTLIGPPLAGIMVEHVGVRSPFILAAVLALADGLARILLVKDPGRVTDDTSGPMAVLRVPGSAALVTVVALGSAVMAAIEPVLPVRLRDELGVGPTGIGLLFALTVLTAAVANPAAGALSVKVPARRLVTAGALVGAASLAGLGWAATVWQAAVAMAGLGIAIALLLAPTTALIGYQGQRCDPPTLGGTYALYNLAYAGGLALGPLLSGAATGVAGFGPAMGVIAVAVVVTGLFSARRLPRPAPSPISPAVSPGDR
ncbi:Predicted arabinose efflux permease, MFS family [Marinactinospora thermotolerans DSM 45154]|uniref:Predicted arabinose efflux permease, MFS family n=1 Tax=Marinactinospora thermotolerans DSM 45154 TaxID=1122192 RepID=A0A1T4PD51_9ACTN|nr:MFS transporter [Marinactinospora thermotolerans]SJZ89505.1 Predicted arabinose efflux permease, MFS family [Marinactinospora thermotolerans DSM 45154]